VRYRGSHLGKAGGGRGVRRRWRSGLAGAVLAGAMGAAAAAEPPANVAAAARMVTVDERGRVSQVDPVLLTAPEGAATPGVGLTAGDLLQLDWPNPRAIRELRLRFGGAPPSSSGLLLSWWREGWPLRADTNEPPRWRRASPEVTLSDGHAVVRFPPGDTNGLPAGVPGGQRFRVTRALRLSFTRDVVLERVEVRTDAVLRRARLRFEWGVGGRRRGRDPVFEARNGRILSHAKTGRHAAVVEVEYAHSDDPLSPDQGRVLFLDGPRGSFAVPVGVVLAAGGLFVRDLGVFVSDPARTPDYAHWAGPKPGRWAGGTVIEQVSRTPEAAFVRDLNEAAAGFRAAVTLSLPGVRQDFVLAPNGDLELRRDALRTPGVDRAARPWPWPVLRWRMGWGKTPRLPQVPEPPVRRRLAENGLPLVTREWRADGLCWRRESLVAPLRGGFAGLTNVVGTETLVLGSRFHVRNPAGQPRTARLWLLCEPPAPLHVAVDGTLILAAPSDGEERAGVVPVRGRVVAPPEARVDLALLTVTNATGTPVTRSAVRCCWELPPRTERVLDLWIPGVELLAPAELAALKALDFAAARTHAVAFWESQLAAAGRVELPAPRLNALFRANLCRLLSALERDPVSGEWHLGPAGGARRLPLNEVAAVVRALDAAGHSAAADHLLAPVLAHQGVRAPRGAVTQRAGAFCAQTADTPDVFGASAPLWQHAAFLSLLVERAPSAAAVPPGVLLPAAEWIQAGRGPDGLMLPGAVRVGGPWVRAFATDGANVRALRETAAWLERRAAVMPPEAQPAWRAQARRWREVAAHYQRQLLAALEDSVAETPLLRLRNDTWIPGVPWRRGALMRGWEERPEEIAVSALRLVNDGVLPPDDPFTGWLLQHLEDNLLLGAWRAEGRPWRPAQISPAPLTLALADVYLARDEIGLCWRALRNALATRLDAETLTLAAPGAGRLPDHLADECRWLRQLRHTLVRETPDRLDLGAGLPRTWLAAGQTLRLTRFPTTFGRLNLLLEGRADAIHARVRLADDAVPPARVRLRLRPPEGRRFREVRVNGHRAKCSGDWLSLPLSTRVWEIRARY